MTEAPQSARPRRTLRMLLLVSAGLNLALIGLIAGALVKGPPDRMRPGPALHSYARAMPERHREALTERMREGNGAWRDMSATRRAQRAALAAALTAEPFEIARVEATLAEERAAADALAAVGAALLAAEIAEMDAETRALYAARILEGRRRRD